MEMGRKKPVRVGRVGMVGREERREGEAVCHGFQVLASFS